MVIKNINGVKDLLKKTSNCNFQLKNKSILNYLYKFYSEFVEIEKKKFNNKPIKTQKITSIQQISNITNLNSSFISKEILHFIKNNTVIEIIYKQKIRNRTITLYFIIQDTKQYSNDIHDTREICKKIFIWYDFIFQYASPNCCNTLDIYIYLTPLKKLMPAKTSDVLSYNNANTGFTTNCVKNGSIVIYRKEELMKVLIHESFHVLGLDFSKRVSENTFIFLKSIFPISSDLNINETYTEVWSEILNIVFTLFLSKRETKVTLKKEDIIEQIYNMIQIETIFSTFQMIKILNFMNMDYSDLYANNEKSSILRLHYYREETNIFAYYIATPIFLFYYDDFIEWCNINNSNILKFNSNSDMQIKFVKFLKKKYKTDKFLNFIQCIESTFFQLGDHYDKYETLMNTLRMTIIEN